MDFEKAIEIKNNLPLKELCGLSPAQMHQIYYDHKENEIIKIKKAKEANIEIPFLKLLNELITLIDFEKGMRLTTTGNLPVKIVKELYDKRIITQYDIEDGITKLSKETDSDAIHCAKIIGLISGNLRKANNRLFVTNKGKKFSENNENLKNILTTFGTKFNLGYLDGYDDEEIGKQSYIFSLYLLHLYGDKLRYKDYYANKYFIALPTLNFELENRNDCYNIRMFDRFFDFFGLVKTIGKYRKEQIIRTELFNKYITFEL